MGTYDNFKDLPDQIRTEGQEITLSFTRNGDGTANICWNIPKPAIGCSIDNQAYDGIVLTVSTKPVNYNSTSPIDGKYYSGDASVDFDINLGDKLDYAHVIGAFYHDKTTKCIKVSDVLDKTPYYFSAYAVDKMGRHHREGVHAYSIPQNSQNFTGSGDSGSRHDIEIDGPNITENSLTGLTHSNTYNMDYTYNGECFSLSIHGSSGQSYKDLVKSLNKEFALLSNPIIGPYPPNSNEYIVDVLKAQLFFWDGFNQSQIDDAIFWDIDPSTPILGTFWYNPISDTLSQYESSGWVINSKIINSPTDPRIQACDDIWFDGTSIWQWDGQIWCKLNTIITNNNPLLPPILSCNSYWYNPSSDDFFIWDNDNNAWQDRLVIVYDKDPNTITTGDFWYNETDDKVYIYLTGNFNELNNIRYEEADSATGELLNPVSNHYWYVPSSGTLFKRNVSNTTWVEQDIVSYPTDPLDRNSCDLWWNISPSVNELYKWDEVNLSWSLTDNFFETVIDPSIPPKLQDNTAWYNPTTNTIELIMGTNCLPIGFLFSIVDPTVTVIGDIWHETINDIWYEWDGLFWQQIQIIVKDYDPFIVSIGSFWFDTIDAMLNKWDGTMWENIPYSNEPLSPHTGTLWFDSVNDILMEWNGTRWENALSDVYAVLILNKNTCDDGKNIICFMTKDTGCGTSLEILRTNNTLITGLTSNVIWYDAIIGQDAFSDKVMYEQLGVGTDGSPDERRKLHAEVRALLGKSSIEVELSKSDLDVCVDSALRTIRKYSSYGYTRGFFFLDGNPNQQRYILGGKCVGFNKIAHVNGIHRTGPFAHGGNNSGGNSLFSYGALQQLYSMQTFDILSYHLVAQYLEELETLFAKQILFQWTEEKRELNIYQVFHYHERLLLDVHLERTEQELIKDRELVQWIQKWTLAEAKMILSQVRGKFQTLPGPNGSTTLNSQELITQAENEKAELIAEISDAGMQDIMDVGLGSHFVIG